MNLIGRKFGRLRVISNSNRKGFVVCKCDCGNIHEVRICNLRNHGTKSCGCYRREVTGATGKRVIQKNSEERVAINERYGTNVGALLNQSPNRNNKCGCRGVYYDSMHNVYKATICLHKQRYYLGTFKHLEEAAKARQEAEERLFAPIIEAVQAERDAQ